MGPELPTSRWTTGRESRERQTTISLKNQSYRRLAAPWSSLVPHLLIAPLRESQCAIKRPKDKGEAMTERRALVVEVDAATRLGLLGFLRARGYQCVAASSPDEAKEALKTGNFTFTLVDLSGNGPDAAELI